VELAVDHPIAEEPGDSLWLHFNLADARAGYFLRASSFFPLRPASCSSVPMTISN
jgi:hypothetical protein